MVFSERVTRGGPVCSDVSGPGGVLGHGQHPGGADPRQVQQARRPQEGGLGRQGEDRGNTYQTELKTFLFIHILLCLLVSLNWGVYDTPTQMRLNRAMEQRIKVTHVCNSTKDYEFFNKV